ncbi:MAG: T9SS type A sorting domain-containing protein, partial [Ignavibacteria bacterium]|nr:T9SS type A sorting domain-containing protein [Ignavibacteria bacterium]
MNNRFLSTLFCLLVISSTVLCQNKKFRNGIFLHHSTGQNIWGPNGSTSSVPQEIINFNSTHGFTGDEAFNIKESWYPSGDNEWYTWDGIFKNEPSFDDIQSTLSTYKIVIIKSCFPSSNIYTWGSSTDTLSTDSKTVNNYKWHWRNMVKVMKNLPHNFFAIWTNAPLVPKATNETEAHLSDLFCTWAKDTLATGLDEITGEFPNNIYIFDFFHKLADDNGFLQLQWAVGEYDSHPNAAATEMVAAPFVFEILNAAIHYEDYLTVVGEDSEIPSASRLEQNYPNPFNPVTTITYQIPKAGKVELKVFDILGREIAILVNSEMTAGKHEVKFNGSNFSSGV